MSQKHVILLDGSLKNLDKRRRRNVKEDASDVLGKARRSLASGTEIQKDEDPKISEHNWHLASASIQKLQFINSNGPFWKQNRQSQRLVRSHVMRGVRREQKLHSRSDNGSSASLGEDDATYQPKQIMSSQIRSSTSLQFGSVFPGSAVSFYGGGYPFVIGPYYHSILNYYLSACSHALYPLEAQLMSNPIRTDWFPIALTDELLFHSIVFSAASRLSFENGQETPADTSVLLKLIYRQLRLRLSGHRDQFSDATVGAVSCLASVENLSGNRKGWLLHMKGLEGLLHARGGPSAVTGYLRLKIHRSDVEGAVDNVSSPHFAALVRSSPSMFSTISPGDMVKPSNSFLDILTASLFKPALVDTFTELYCFSRAIEHAMTNPSVVFHPASYDEDVILILYKLLSNLEYETLGLETACRLGALIYMKALTREMPLSSKNSIIIVHHLRNAIDSVLRDSRAEPWIPWLLVMGGFASRGSRSQTWFLEKLRHTTVSQTQLSSCDAVQETLRGILWVRSIHEKHCKELWGELENVRAYGASDL